MKKAKYIVFSHKDLDGAGSLLVLKWLFPHIQFEYKGSTSNTFRKDFTTWQSQHDPIDYKKIFVTDLDVTTCADIIDMPNVVLIDHHPQSVLDKDKFEHASTILEVCDSCSLLIYKRLGTNSKLTDEQKRLILLINDYDCYRLDFSDSIKLNAVFGNVQGDKISKFCESFHTGFHGFNQLQQNMIAIQARDLRKQKEDLKVFIGEVQIQDAKRIVAAAFITNFPNEIAEYLIEDYSADIAITVNLASKRVSFRKARTSNANLSILAEKLCEGGGHEYASGGVLTDTFMEFTKFLSPE